MYKKLFALLLLSTTLAHSCCSLLNIPGMLSNNGVGIGGYWDLSAKYYPKTVAYFNELKEKYSDLKELPIIILDGPMADWNTIYFPMKWIEELEKGNKFYREATEWILLHEAGHIVHKDVSKQIGLYLISALGLNAIANVTDSDLQLAIAGASICSGIYYLYRGFTLEYYADDYAIEHCDNPAAWIAAYEFLDRHAPLGFLPGIMHSFTTYRLSRISAAFHKKFGYELVVVPQSISPTYLEA